MDLSEPKGGRWPPCTRALLVLILERWTLWRNRLIWEFNRGTLSPVEGAQELDPSPTQLLMLRLPRKCPTLDTASEENQAIPQAVTGIHMGNGLRQAG